MPTRAKTVSAWILGVACLVSPAMATGITASDARLEFDADAGIAHVSALVAWENAWRTDKNHDSAWIVVKYSTPAWDGWVHLDVAPDGHALADGAMIDGPPPEWVVPGDGVGLFAQPSLEHRGSISWPVRLRLAEGAVDTLERVADPSDISIEVLAIEMVHIPEGGFTLGDPGERGRQYASFFRSDDAGEPAGLLRIESERPIEVGPSEGRLHYRVSPDLERFGYEGDQQGPIPGAFPKGFGAFYCMKYEITQGQYARFLNMQWSNAGAMRDPIGGRRYFVPGNRATIRVEGDRYVAGAPERPANFISWDDACAFADWMGLRPMTELEFTKACRGPEAPNDGQYPWGSAAKDSLVRTIGEDLDLVTSGDADEALLTDSSREAFGASYWWVMDLAGSVWERCVTIGHPVGRAFEGTHGNGRIDGEGFATNDDWPRGDGGPSSGGYGYRGGGHYEAGREYEPGGFNPHSPIAWRRFGSWGAAPRTMAYGARCVRTDPR